MQTVSPEGQQRNVPTGCSSNSFTLIVVKADIVQTNKYGCVCSTTTFSVTGDSSPDIAWEIWPDEPGGAHFTGGNSGTSVQVNTGTNCGAWQVVARSTLNTNCTDSAALTVVRVEGLSPDGGTLVSTNPPTCVVCPVPTNSPDPYLTVCASPCPGLEETNLPACWQLTGGQGTNRLCRQVDRRQLGTTTITATAGCSSKTVVIMVQDTNPPSLACSDMPVCTDLGWCSAIVEFDPSASDDCGYVTVTCDPPSGSEFEQGTNPVSVTATDLAGNTTNCTFNVIVNDCEPPAIICSTNIIRCADPSGTNTVTWPNPTATDNCAVTNVACNPPSGSNFPVGETVVTCTATDSSGNQSQCTFSVKVVDLRISYPDDADGNGLIDDPWSNEFSFDESSPALLVITCIAAASPDSDKFRWTIEDVGEIRGFWNPHVTGNQYIGTGPNPTVTFTGMPLHNSAFGRKKITLAYEGLTCSDEETIEVFFHPAARNNPGPPGENPPNGVAREDLVP